MRPDDGAGVRAEEEGAGAVGGSQTEGEDHQGAEQGHTVPHEQEQQQQQVSNNNKKRENAKKSIATMENQAMAKIPQVVEADDNDKVTFSRSNVTRIRLGGSNSIGFESEKVHRRSSSVKDMLLEDSDSAIIPDCPLSLRLSGSSSLASPSSSRSPSEVVVSPSNSSPSKMSKRVSRSVSDVINDCDSNSSSSLRSASEELAALFSRVREIMEEEEEDDDDGTSSNSSEYSEQAPPPLMRQGSFERFKTSDQAKNTSSTRRRRSLVGDLRSMSLDHNNQQHSKPQGINHRSVTTPRDVKNRSSCKKQALVRREGSVYSNNSNWDEEERRQ